MSEAPDIYRIKQRLTWAFAATAVATGLVVGWVGTLALEPAVRLGDVVRAVLLLLTLGGAHRSLWVARRELTRLISFHEYLSENVQVVAFDVPCAAREIQISVTARRRDVSTVN